MMRPSSEPEVSTMGTCAADPPASRSVRTTQPPSASGIMSSSSISAGELDEAAHRAPAGERDRVQAVQDREIGLFRDDGAIERQRFDDRAGRLEAVHQRRSGAFRAWDEDALSTDDAGEIVEERFGAG